MKIIQINKFFFLKGGAERYFFDLSDLLVNQGHEVSVWSSHNPLNLDWPEKNNFAPFVDFSKEQSILQKVKNAKNIFWNKQAKNKLELILEKEKPDIAHLHNVFGQLSPSIIFALKKHKIPIVLTLHDYKLFCPNYKFFSQHKPCYDCLNYKYRSCIFKKCIHESFVRSLIGYLEYRWQKDFLKVASQIDVFLAPSLFIRQKALRWGIDSNKVIHLPNFINREKHNLINTKKYFLYFGRLSQEKGIDLLINSFLNSSLRDDWHLKIVGQGPEKENLAKLAQGTKRIEFLGELKGKELKKIISQSYAVVVPSRWPENFPYTVLESFTLAKPVIAARIGGLPEMVEDKKNGLLFKANDQKDLINKIDWAVKNQTRMKEMGKNSQVKVEKQYNAENHYQKLIQIYERIKNN